MSEFKYIIFGDLDQANEFLASTDAYFNMPEQEPDFYQVGGGTHANWELGRALHYCTPTPNQYSTHWMVLYTDCIELPEGAEAVESLPTDWYPEQPEM